MASDGNSTEVTDKDSIWVLDQNFDQPMDEEAENLKSKYEEKVKTKTILSFFKILYSASSSNLYESTKLLSSLIQHHFTLFFLYQKSSSLLLLGLAFQSLGVVYGDLGTSPLYVFYNTFPDGIKDPEDVIGALSLIIYSLTLIPLLKYVLIVCRANDNGQGKLVPSLLICL